MRVANVARIAGAGRAAIVASDGGSSPRPPDTPVVRTHRQRPAGGRRPGVSLPSAAALPTDCCMRATNAGLALLAAALAVAAPTPAPAQEAEEIQDRILESQERLEQIRNERDNLRKQMRELEQRVSTRREELDNLERQIGTTSSVVAELDVQIRARRDEVEALTRETLRTRDELTVREVELRQRLRQIYKRGPARAVQVLLSAESFSDLIHRYKYLHLVSQYDRALVEQVGRLEEQLEEQRTELQRDLTRLRRLRGDKRSELQELENLENQYQRQISRLQSEESRQQSRLARLAQEERKLQDLMDDLEQLRREAERREGRVTTSSLRTSDLGQLDWPVEGEVLYRFGPQRDEGTTVNRDGIGIGAPAGTPVQAVESGRVAWAGERGLYGPSVIVSHGGGYYSVYLYLGRARVQEGARVSKGQVLGTVGGAGSREGAHIQFEIHVPGSDGSPRPVDPVRWLRGRG